MAYRVMRVDSSSGASVAVFPAVNDEWGALYLAVGLLNAKEEIPLFWVERPDGTRAADPKGISDFADQNGYPNLWRVRRQLAGKPC